MDYLKQKTKTIFGYLECELSSVCFDFRILPTFLELVADCTYPINQGATMCVMQFCNYIQTGLLIAAENMMNRQLSKEELMKQTCYESGSSVREKQKDPLPYTILIVSWTTIFVLTYVFGFNPEMKRSNAEKSNSHGNTQGSDNIDTDSNESGGLILGKT